MAQTIAVEELSIGMFIQLDGGWLSHPFPVSSFRLITAEQLSTVRGMGLKQVRWVPEKSELPSSAPVSAAPQECAPAVPTADGAVVALRRPQAGALRAAAGTDAERAAAEHRQRVLEQQQAYQRCEQQHGEASRALSEVMDSVQQEPARAGRSSQALTQAMLDKMLNEDNVGIRLVSPSPDRESGHGLNVGVISLLVGRTLGLDDDELLDLGVGALLHDVGKLELPERCRHLEAGQNHADMQHYRDHVAKGVLLGQRMALSAGALAVLAQHHELADGSGFPQRSSNDSISLAARVVAIVNRYDNLCNPRTRSLALTPHEAVATLFAQSRNRFDSAVLNAFIRMMGVYPAGSLVQLTDDRFAMVVGANSSRPLKPRVLVHEAQVPRAEALLLDLELQPDLGIRRSMLAHKLPAATLQYLDPRPRVSYYFEPLHRGRLPEELAA